jgi:molybdopterin-containing oxidoreductase family iron-sulfur binding subunit
VGATTRGQDRIVAQIYARCIGCRYCTTACPYTLRYFNWYEPRWPGDLGQALNPDVSVRPKGVVEKCTFCTERLAVGKIPACVEAAPKGGMFFGDLANKNSEVRKIIETRYTIRRKPELGTGPSVYYLIGGTEHA